MFALDAASRVVLGAAAFAAFGAAFVTTPFVARGEAGIVADRTPTPVPRAVRPALADIVPRRDPFAGGDAPAARPYVAPAQSPVAVAAMPRVPAELRPLPPNAGAGEETFPFAAGARTGAVVTAVTTGPHPFALVDVGGATQLLTIGDRIDADPIVAIDAAGIRLSGGTVLAVARGAAAAAPAHTRSRLGGH